MAASEVFKSMYVLEFVVRLKFLKLKKLNLKKKRTRIDHKGSSQFHLRCPEPIPKD